MVTEADIRLPDGRALHAYVTRADGIASAPAAVGWGRGIGYRRGGTVSSPFLAKSGTPEERPFTGC
jgi:hypothetical protein